QTQDRIMELRPITIDEAELTLKRTAEFLTSFESHNSIPFNEFEDIEEELKLMVIENFRLDAKSFIKIKNITAQIGRLQKFLPNFADTFPHLIAEIKDLDFRKEIIDRKSTRLNSSHVKT